MKTGFFNLQACQMKMTTMMTKAMTSDIDDIRSS